MQRVWFRVRTQFHYRVSHTHSTHNATQRSHFRTGPLATQRLLPRVRNHAVGSQLLAWQCNGCFSCSGITPWAPSPSERWGPSSGRSGWGPGAGRSGGAGPGAGGAVGAWAPAAANGARFDNITYNSASGIEEQRIEDSKAVGFGSGYRARATAMLQEFRRTVVGMIAAAVRQWDAYAILVLPSTARQPIISSERCSLLPCAAALKNKKQTATVPQCSQPLSFPLASLTPLRARARIRLHAVSTTSQNSHQLGTHEAGVNHPGNLQTQRGETALE